MAISDQWPTTAGPSARTTGLMWPGVLVFRTLAGLLKAFGWIDFGSVGLEAAGIRPANQPADRARTTSPASSGKGSRLPEACQRAVAYCLAWARVLDPIHQGLDHLSALQLWDLAAPDRDGMRSPLIIGRWRRSVPSGRWPRPTCCAVGTVMGALTGHPDPR